MIRLAFGLLLILFLLPLEAESQKQSLLKKDLQVEWLTYTSTGYQPYDQAGDPVSAIYFFLDPRTFGGDYLQIESENNFCVFVNREFLIEATGIKRIYMDSLNLSGEVLVAIHQRGNITKQVLSTRLYTDIPNLTSYGDNISLFRKSMHFRDFVITATLFLFVFFILMIQLNPRLSSDYFSLNKLFTLREGDDDQFYLRITSANILFYVFTSMMLALFIFLVTEFTNMGFNYIPPLGDSFGEVLLTWSKISLVIFAFLFLKIVLVFVVSFLFHCNEAAGYHFFNFIRVLLVITTLLTLILIGYFMLHGSDETVYHIIFKSFGWAMGAYTIILFFKLGNRVRFSPIHLFSYICATEILPFLTIVKILYE